MAYITGSVTDANPGPALHALMAPALTTAGFTLVDTVTISTRTHKVWKSPAAGNVQNLDWYLDVAYTTTGAGNLWLLPFEYYDPATDLGYRGPVGNNSTTTIEATYFSRYGATGSALETNWMSATQTPMSVALPVSTFGYWISVTGDRVAVLLSNDPAVVLYAGMYQPDPLYAAKAGGSIYPLIAAKCNANGGADMIAQTSTAANGTAALTRLPPHATLGSGGWGAALKVTPGVKELASMPAIPTVSAGYPPVVWPVALYSQAGVAPTTFGTLRDVAVTAAAAGVARGDTLTVGGSLWTLGSVSTSVALLLKQV